MPKNNETEQNRHTCKGELHAGCFSSWLRRTRHGLATEKASVVNCGPCKACCTSSYFIHIRPEEKQALSHIDKKLLFPAPGLPKGNVLLGYFENGHCPMMTDKGCSIYAHRPLTCRTYDCRIFAAAGIDAGGADQEAINQQARHWQFCYPTARDRAQHEAVKAAALFLQTHADAFPTGMIPRNPSQLALMALKVYQAFLGNPEENAPAGASVRDTAEKVTRALEKFNKRCARHE